MIIELFNCTNTLLRLITDKKLKQKDIASIYALAIKSNEQIDWTTVNKAIINRWSISGLKKIKKMAWKY